VENIEHGAAALVCLDRQLDDLGARIELMRVVDRDMVRHAVVAAERTTAAGRCLDAAWVAREPQGVAASIDAELLRARVQSDMGHFDEAIAAARVAAEEAEKAGDAYRLARALYSGCRARIVGRRDRDKSEVCTEAWAAAERAGSDTLAIGAMIDILKMSTLEQTHESERLERIVQARIDGLLPEQRDWNLEYSLAMAISQRLRDSGKFREARVQGQRAFDIVLAEQGPEDPSIVAALNELALTARELGELAVARDHFARGHGLLLATRGPAHPDCISLENNIAGLDISLGRYEQAIEQLGRVLAAKEALEGERAIWLITTLYQYVEALTALGRGEEAIVHGQRALSIAEGVHGRDSIEIVSPIVSLATALRVADRCEDALALLERSDRIESTATVRDPEFATRAVLQRGLCQERLGQTQEAGASLERAVALRETYYGPGTRAVAEALLPLAEWEREHGSKTRARELLMRADDICRATEGDPALARRIADALAAAK
jgi:tetratricopeptide (TPR) repeat protein